MLKSANGSLIERRNNSFVWGNVPLSDKITCAHTTYKIPDIRYLYENILYRYNDINIISITLYVDKLPNYIHMVQSTDSYKLASTRFFMKINV